MTRALLAVAALGCAPQFHAADRPNVLLLLFDDLRPQLGCYGDPVVKSPHLDRFAATALRFDRAYCQSAICSPSRNSFLSGLRPATTGLYGFGTTLREKVPDAVTLPQHFKNHGYHAAAVGKVFHVYAETGLGSEDDPASWSEPLYLPKKTVWGPDQEKLRLTRVAEAKAAGKEFKHSHDWPRAEIWDAPDVPDDELQDGEIAGVAVDRLTALKAKDEPFFLAVGFLKPHLPNVAPKKYFDLYDAANLTLPANRTRPTGAPAWALGQGIGTGYANTPTGAAVTDAYLREFLRSYLACVSYADACAGRVLAALGELGLRDNTVVVAVGDHGYQMGDHGWWATKHTAYETSTRVPLLVSAPGMATAGRGTRALVELVDLYPTLADVCGLPAPARVEGASFKPLLADPSRAWKPAAFSEIRRAANRHGSAVRTDRYRYVEWTDAAGKVVARELYDHTADPGENTNVADRPESAAAVAELSGRLRAGWKAARPN